MKYMNWEQVLYGIKMNTQNNEDKAVGLEASHTLDKSLPFRYAYTCI